MENKFKKLTLTAALAFAGSLSLNAQVVSQKIGDNPTIINSSAVLDVESLDKGVLLPRVALTSATDVATILTPTTSMLVYNTATAGTAPNDVTPGYYYWNGTAWTRIATGTLTSVTGTAPIAVATGTTTPVISLNNLGIQNIHLAADAVTSDKILDGTILNADLANGVGGIYKGSGSLAGATTVTGGANTLAFTSTATNGFSVDGNTFSVDAANNRVGIGTAAPSTPLHINSATAGAFRLEDGTQGAGKVIVSDANGVGTWQNIGMAVDMSAIMTLTNNNSFTKVPGIPVDFPVTINVEPGIYYVDQYHCEGQIVSFTGTSDYWILNPVFGNGATGQMLSRFQNYSTMVPTGSDCGFRTSFIVKVFTAGTFTFNISDYNSDTVGFTLPANTPTAMQWYFTRIF